MNSTGSLLQECLHLARCFHVLQDGWKGSGEDKTLSKDRTCTHLLSVLPKPGSSWSTSLGVPDTHYSLHILGVTFDLPKVSQGSIRGFSEPP